MQNNLNDLLDIYYNRNNFDDDTLILIHVFDLLSEDDKLKLLLYIEFGVKKSCIILQVKERNFFYQIKLIKQKYKKLYNTLMFLNKLKNKL